MERIRADKGVLNRLPTPIRRGIVWGLIGSAGLAAWIFGNGPRSAVEPTGALLAAAIGAPIPLHPLHHKHPRLPRARVVAALLIPVAVGAIPLVPSAAVGIEALTEGARCFGFGAAVTAAFVAVMALTERRTVRPLSHWIASVALAGAVASVAMALWCPADASLHRAIAHGAFGLVGSGIVAAGGVLFGARSGRVSRTPTPGPDRSLRP